MTQEHELSIRHETYLEAQALRKKWEEENLVEEYSKSYQAAQNEEQARQLYLKCLYSAESSTEIINYDWTPYPSFKKKNNLLGAKSKGVRGRTKSTESSPLDRGRSGALDVFSLDVINQSEFEKSTVHIGGMHQSRSIAGLRSTASIDPGECGER